jgi:hypothetical protein
MTSMKEQLVVAFSQILVLEEMVAAQAAMLTKQQAWNSAMTMESQNTSSRLVSADAKAEVAQTAIKAVESAVRARVLGGRRAICKGGGGRRACTNPLPPVRARQPSRAADSSSALRGGGGGWGPPLCIGKREVGTYIYSRTNTTHGPLGDFLKSLRLLM